MSEQNKYWYAVYTRPRWEKKVSQILTENGIENYCPLNKVIKQWSDRKKVVLEPVFKTYVFIKVADEKKWEIKKISGILNYVYWLGKPAKINEEEILSIRKFLKDFSDITVQQLSLKANDKVRITQGLLMNYEGKVLELSGKKAKLRIESMGIVLIAKIENRNLELLSSN